MLKQRVVTALVAVIALLAVVFVAPVWLARAVIALVFLVGAWEWSGLLGAKSPPGKWLFVALLALAQSALFLTQPGFGVYTAIAYAAAGWWVAALIWMFFFPTAIPLPVRWVAGLLVLLPAYVAIDWLYQASPAMLMALLCVVWLADIGAYFAGRAFGRVKLAPQISPGKTWEGVIGGLLAVAVATLLASLLSLADFALGVLIPFALAVALVSIVGDLTVSMFKRSAGVKDSGTLFPGHGGVLDRIDSVSAAAPLFAVGFALVGSG